MTQSLLGLDAVEAAHRITKTASAPFPFAFSQLSSYWLPLTNKSSEKQVSRAAFQSCVMITPLFDIITKNSQKQLKS